MKPFFSAYAPALVWAAAILVVCLTPAPNLPNVDFWAIDIEDKLIHIGIFAVLVLLQLAGATRRPAYDTATLRRHALIAVLFAALTELLQHLLVATRTASFFDFIADSLGVLVALLLTKVLPSLRPQRSTSH